MSAKSGKNSGFVVRQPTAVARHLLGFFKPFFAAGSARSRSGTAVRELRGYCDVAEDASRGGYAEISSALRNGDVCRELQ